MSLTDQVREIDSKVAKGQLVDVANEHYDKSVEAHVQNFAYLKGKSAAKSIERFADMVGSSGKVEVLATRTIEDDNSSVSLYSIEGSGESDTRVRLLLLVARKFSDKGKIVEEEYLPVRSTADAQTYFPETRLPIKQVQPRLSFITPTRKRRGKGGGRPRKAPKDTDLHRIPTIGKTVLDALNKAGITTFEMLSTAADEVLESVKSVSGRRFVNFDTSYWREAAGHAFRGEWDKMPDPPKASKKSSKKNAQVDFSQVEANDLSKLPKVGPNMLQAMHSEGIHTFADLSKASEEKLARLKEKGGRPFVNFDMSYFPKAAQRVVAGDKNIPAPPKPSGKSAGKGLAGRKARDINPNDLHILPGVGAQLVKALHDRGINTFSDLAEADRSVLAEARSETKGKYKNIDLKFLQRQAKHAAAEKYGKIKRNVKIEKSAKSATANAEERHQARLANAKKQDLEVLPGIGASVKEAMNNAGIGTFAQLAAAKPEKLREIANNAGKRFARFDVNFWKQVAAHAQAGEFDKIPVKPPTAAKPKPSGKKRGGQRGPRQARPPRQPRDQRDLGALPTIGATIINALRERNINTFAQLSSASDAKLEEVRAASGPKYKTFPVSFWREAANVAKEGSLDYPPVPRKEKKASGGRRGRAPREIPPTELTALPNVGSSLASALRESGINNWQDIVDAEPWKLMKAAHDAGKRFRKMNPEVLRKSAQDAINGKFPKPKKRGKRKSQLPPGADKLTELDGIGAKVQEKLFERKIMTYDDLAKANINVLEEVRDSVGKRVAKANVRDWKSMAKLATEGRWSEINPSKYEDSSPTSNKGKRPKAPKGGDDLTKIKGIGPQAQMMFHTRGIKTYQDLVNMRDDALMSLLEESGARVNPEDFEQVRTAAAQQLSKSSKGKGKSKKSKV